MCRHTKEKERGNTRGDQEREAERQFNFKMLH